MKKPFISVLVIAILLVLSACQASNSNNSSTGGTSSTAPGTQSASTEAGTKPVIALNFGYTSGGKFAEANEELVKRFNESQSEIKVTAQMLGSAYADALTKLQAAYVAKNAPDVFVLENVNTAALAKAGILQNLTGFVTDAKKNDIVPSMLGNSYFENQLYSLPYQISTNILYLNATLLKEAGLNPSGPKTWDELKEFARKLAIPDKRYGITLNLDSYRYESTISSAGGQMLSDDGARVAFNSAEGLAAFELWKSMNAEKTMNYPISSGGTAVNDITKQDFMTGRSAMFFGTSSYITDIEENAKKNGFELSAAVFPKKDPNVKFSGIAQGGNIGMLSGLSDEKRQAAWKFIDFLTGADQQAYYSSMLGYVPPTHSGINTSVMQDLFAKNPLFGVAAKQMELSAPRPMGKAYSEIITIVNNQLQRMIVDAAVTPKQALDEAANQAAKVLSK